MSALEPMVSLFVFLLGLVWGSFCNVLIWRLPRGEEIGGRSQCPECGQTLAAADLVPLLSYVFLGGRCRYCRAPISARYPLVEAVTGGLFVLAYRHAGAAPAALAVYLTYVTVAVVVFFADYIRATIPNAVIVPGFLAALASALFGLAPSGPAAGWALLAGLAGGGLFLVLYVISRGGGMGMGDVKLAAFIGLAVGPLKLLVAVLIGSITAVLGAGVVLAVAGRRLRSLKSVEISIEQEEEPEVEERVFGMMLINGRPAVPFGTFLALGFTVTLFWGDVLVRLWLGG